MKITTGWIRTALFTVSCVCLGAGTSAWIGAGVWLIVGQMWAALLDEIANGGRMRWP